MATLDSCINDIFETGNTATDSGAFTTPHYSGYLLLEGDAVDSVTASLSGPDQFTAYISVEGSGYLLLTITGTWTGRVDVPLGNSGNAFSYTGNVANVPISQPGYSEFRAGFVDNLTYGSGTAVVTLTSSRGPRIELESTTPPLLPVFLLLE